MKILPALLTKSFSVAALFILLSMPAISVGTPIVWTVTDVTFDPSGSAAGSFTFDNGSITDFSFATDHLGYTLFGMYDFSFDESNSVASISGNTVNFLANFIYLDDSNREWDITRLLSLSFNGPLNVMTSSLEYVNERLTQVNLPLEFNGGPNRRSYNGSATSSVPPASVPEPSISALFLLGVGLLSLASRHKKQV